MSLRAPKCPSPGVTKVLPDCYNLLRPLGGPPYLARQDTSSAAQLVLQATFLRSESRWRTSHQLLHSCLLKPQPPQAGAVSTATTRAAATKRGIFRVYFTVLRRGCSGSAKYTLLPFPRCHPACPHLPTTCAPDHRASSKTVMLSPKSRSMVAVT